MAHRVVWSNERFKQRLLPHITDEIALCECGNPLFRHPGGREPYSPKRAKIYPVTYVVPDENELGIYVHFKPMELDDIFGYTRFFYVSWLLEEIPCPK